MYSWGGDFFKKSVRKNEIEVPVLNMEESESVSWDFATDKPVSISRQLVVVDY